MIEVRSYRRVFDLERRIYRVDRLRLNPAGVPVRGVIYFLLTLAASLASARLPVAGGVVSSIPWFLRSLLLPGGLAAVLTVIRLEGRPFHLAAVALVRHLLEPRSLAGLRRASSPGARWCPPPVMLLPDGSGHRMRRLRYQGPGAVRVTLEHELAAGVGARPGALAHRVTASTVRVAPLPDARPLRRGRVIELDAGARLIVVPARAGGLG